ncbi:hypothetical protein V3C99_017831 [Haemonchus contortus]
MRQQRRRRRMYAPQHALGHLAMSMDSYKSLATQIGRLRLRRWAQPQLRQSSLPTHQHQATKRRSWKRFRWISRGSAQKTMLSSRKQSPVTSINENHFASLTSEWEDPATDNVDEEYNPLVEHLHHSARKAKSLQAMRRSDEGSIRKARQSFANYNIKMTSLRRPDDIAFRKATEKVIYDLYSDLFGSHVFLPIHHLGQYEYIAPLVLLSEM